MQIEVEREREKLINLSPGETVIQYRRKWSTSIQ